MHLAGVDMVTGTPVLDIKPYIPQYDSPQPQHTTTQVRLWWTLVAVPSPFALISVPIFRHDHVPIIQCSLSCAQKVSFSLEIYSIPYLEAFYDFVTLHWYIY